jgi:parallel beta-helix repeat protein
LLCSIFLCFSVVSSTKTCLAEVGGIVYVRADGSTDPSTAPMLTVDNVTYTLTGDMFNDSIVIERDNIVVDGAFHTVEGIGGEYGIGGNGITLSARTNVTIKNMTIKAFGYGIFLGSSLNSNISGNNITSNGHGIDLWSSSSNNSISENNITNNYYEGISLDHSSGNSISENNITANSHSGIQVDYSNYSSIFGNAITNNGYGIYLTSSSYNVIYHNNFVNNTSQIYSATGSTNGWDNGFEGNYWSNHIGIDSNHDGINDISYIIDENNIDYYPLMVQYVIPEFPSFLVMPLFMIATLLAIAIYKRRILTRAP